MATNPDPARQTTDPTAAVERVVAITTHRPEEIVNSVSDMGAETHVVSVDGSAGLISRAIETVRQTRNAIRSTDPEVLLLDCYEVMGALVTLLSIWYDVPVVARLVGDTWRGLDEEGVQPALAARDYRRYVRYRLALLLDEFIFDHAIGFVVVSEELKRVVHERTGRPLEQIGVVPVPVTRDTWQTGSAASARQAIGLDQRQVLLTVTNLQFRGKFEGVKTAVDELRPVLAADSEVGYVIAGGGSYHAALLAYLEETIEDPDVRRRIYAPGFVDDVGDLYALADVFVYVSQRDGYPNAVLEAQTAGLPVVANDAHGMAEQIADGTSGYLVDPSTPGTLRERVSTLLEHPDLRSRLGRGARQRVLRENVPAAVGERLQTVLDRLVRNAR